MNKLFNRILPYVIIFLIIIIPNIIRAENVTMTATGEYIMGDRDTYIDAKKLALQDAKRIMLEKVGTYIESKTEVQNGVVSNDEIKEYTAGIVKIETISDERSISEDKATIVKVNVKASVDPDAIIKQISSFHNRTDIEESAKKYSADNIKLRKEIDQLNQQLRNVVDEDKYNRLRTQREDALKKIDANDKGLTMIINGESLYAAALYDRQKKDNAKEAAINFLKVLPSLYKISISPTPKVEYNNDGETANVTFDIHVNLPIDSTDMHSNLPIIDQYSKRVTAINGIKLDEFQSTGINIRKGGPLDSIIIRCENRNFMHEFTFNLNPILLFVTLGHDVQEEGLTLNQVINDNYGYQIVRYNHVYKITFKIPISDLKLLSQIEAKVDYRNHK